MKLYSLIILLFMVSIVHSGFAQKQDKPIYFEVMVHKITSYLRESCNTGGKPDHVAHVQTWIDNRDNGDHCYTKDATNSPATWNLDQMLFNEWLPKIPLLKVQYWGYEESCGSSCSFDNHCTFCTDNQQSKETYYYDSTFLTTYGPPAQWNTIIYSAPRQFYWINYRYNPPMPKTPKLSGGNPVICGNEYYTLTTNDVLPKWNETYIWEDSIPGGSWNVIATTADTVLTLKAPDISTISSRYYRVRSQYNSVLSVPSNSTNLIPILPKRPDLTHYQIKQPSCFGGGDASITLDSIKGHLGNGVNNYRYSLKWNNQNLSLNDPRIYSLPYTIDKLKVAEPLKAGNYSLILENEVIVNGTSYITCFSTFNFSIGEPPLLVLTSEALKKGTGMYNISCKGANDGIVQVSGTGGTPPYKFTLTGGGRNEVSQLNYIANQAYQFRNLKPAIPYVVSVTDANGCIQTSSNWVLTEPPALLAYLSLNNYPGSCNIKCNGSKDTCFVLAKGGVAPYNVSVGQTTNTILTDGGVGYIQNLTANTSYQIKLWDANGCIVSKDTSLKEPPVLVVEELTLTRCNGEGNGSIEVKASGGVSSSGNYHYILKSGTVPFSMVNGSDALFQSLHSGTYLLQAVDRNQCVLDTSILIPVSAVAPQLKDTVICQSQTLHLVMEDTSYTYVWKGTKGYRNTGKELATNVMDRYQLEVTNRYGCTDTTSFSLTVSNRSFNANFAMASAGFSGDTIVISEVSWPRPSSMVWNIPSLFDIVETDGQLQYIKLPEPGVYSVKLTGFLGECRDVIEKQITVLEAAQDTAGRFSLGFRGIKALNVYPNPNTGIFTLEIELTEAMDADINVYDLYTANALHSIHQSGKKNYILYYNLKLTPGTYTISVRTKSDKQDFKFVIQH